MRLNPSPQFRRDAQEGRFLMLAIAVVAASAVTNTVIALQGGLYADDLRESSRAAVDPWSLDWILGWETYRHLAPLERAHFSLFVEVAPLSHLFPAGLMALELSAALLLFYLVARRLLDRPWALIGLVLLASTPLLTATHAWLIQGVSLYGVLIGVLLAALGLLGYIADKRRRWLALAGVGWLVAAGTWETWLAGPPSLFLLVLVLQTEGRVEDRLLATWKAAEPFWLITAAIAGGYLALWRLGGYGTAAELPTASEALVAIWDSLYLMLIPGFSGGPWEWFAPENSFSPLVAPPSAWFVLAAVFAAAAGLAVLGRNRGQAARGIAIFLVVPALTMALPVLGRLTQFEGAVQREPRYVAPSLTFAVLGLAMVGRASDVQSWSRRSKRIGVLALCSIVAGIMITDARFVRIWEQNQSGAYTANARASLERDGTEAQIFNTRVPPAVLTSWFGEYTEAREVLRPVMRDAVSRFGGAESRLMFDDTGHLVPAQFYPLTWAPLAGCQLVPAGQSRTIALERAQIHEKNLTLRIEATAAGEGSVIFQTGTGIADAPAAMTGVMPVSRGTNDAYFLLPEKRISDVTIAPEGTTVCVQSLVIGQPAP